MPADKIVLLSHRIAPRFLKLAEQGGDRKGGYASYIDLSRTSAKLPVRLYCGGIHNGIHKIQFIDPAHLGLSRVREIVLDVFGDTEHVRISRLDWCVDLWGISAEDVALYCKLARVQNSSVERSRSGVSFYLRRSRNHILLLYNKVQQLRSNHDPLAEYYSRDDSWTRVEVQLRGRALPYRKLADIKNYADMDLLSGISFWSIGRKKEGLTPRDALAAEALLHKIEQLGLQVTSKLYPSSKWAYLQEKFFIPASESQFPNLSRLMQSSIRDWLQNRIRFPRLQKRGAK